MSQWDGRHVAIVVMGDFSRSPRMQYHTRCFAAAGARVTVLALDGSPVADDLRAHPAVRLFLRPAADGRARAGFAFLLYAAWRAARQGLWLLWHLLRLPHMDLILVQTPPAQPVLGIVGRIARWRGVPWTIDWHNFGYSLLALRLGATHPLVGWARRYEQRWGRRADTHLAVSAAMAEHLRQSGLSPVTVLRDRGDARFRRLDLPARHRFFVGEGAVLGLSVDGQSYFTRAAATGEVSEAPTRAALVVTATSWTRDEDFGLLLEALDSLERAWAAKGADGLRLWMVITGTGAGRSAFEATLAGRAWRHVRVSTGWLSEAGYAALLGAADLGLSLHRSSSGLDLPMKVADMQGAGLPVLALDYGPCLGEMLSAGVDGDVFADAASLAAMLEHYLDGFPGPQAPLFAVQRQARAPSRPTWADEWRSVLMDAG